MRSRSAMYACILEPEDLLLALTEAADTLVELPRGDRAAAAGRAVAAAARRSPPRRVLVGPDVMPVAGGRGRADRPRGRPRGSRSSGRRLNASSSVASQSGGASTTSSSSSIEVRRDGQRERARVRVLTDVLVADHDADPRIRRASAGRPRWSLVRKALSQITISRVASEVRSRTFSTHFCSEVRRGCT